MGFDRRDIRKGMDVYDAHGAYLGVVLGVEGTIAPRTPLGPVDEGSAVSGELLGPAPTAPRGNPGPATQGASRRYNSAPDADPLADAVLKVGRWPGLFGVRRVPLSEVATVSLERIALARASGS